MKITTLLTILFFPVLINAQTVTVPVQQVNQIDDIWLKLDTDNPTLREDYLLNEQLLDLVQVYEADSVFKKKKQHHRSGFGIISLFGYHWKAIQQKRVKFVGTSVRSYGAPGEPQFTEYDIKYNMVGHLPHYMQIAVDGYQLAKEMNRHEAKKQDKTVAPYIDPTPETTDKYYLHNELTPDKDYWYELDSLFFPCIAGTKHEDHVNFGEKPISLGIYGVLVSDCNHGCRPEIHPYEWIWWLEVNPKHDDRPAEKRWLVGLFRESSNRFKRWSKPPRRGVISIPFLFQETDLGKEIYVEHLVNSEMRPDGLEDLDLSEEVQSFDQTKYAIVLDGTDKTIMLSTNKAFPQGVKWWISDLQTDGSNIAGYINIAASVKSVYTARVTIK